MVHLPLIVELLTLHFIIQKQRSSSQSLNYNFHVCTQFLQTNDLSFKFCYDDFLAVRSGQELLVNCWMWFSRVDSLRPDYYVDFENGSVDSQLLTC